MKTSSTNEHFAVLLQRFFLQRLMEQRNSSDQTIAAYRDAFKLLFWYLQEKHHLPPDAVVLEDLNSKTILGFLKYLEQSRHNTIRSRNARLAALRSFLKYATHQVPTLLPMIQKVLAIPMKRFQRPAPEYLTREQMQAILVAPDASTWSGQRDRVLLATLYNTGVRVSEIIALKPSDIDTTRSMSVKIVGKGRKHRVIPLWKSTGKQIQLWIKHLDAKADSPLFPNARGQFMTRSGVENRLQKAVEIAAQSDPTLKERSISPHVFRHTTAMHLLQSGVDITVIALWLGHESPVTTHMYMEADLTMKEKALQRVQQPAQKTIRYKPSDRLLQFLQRL
ncbi:MAG: tyrosine-type recombinase/integrase [Deltaproteobacteria bacterium]|nr:tyrosine-type recombinase/integrase [Deltaproteobacteria bacterium]